MTSQAPSRSAAAPASIRTARPAGDRSAFRAAGLPWFGLDEGWTRERRLGALSLGADGLVEYGMLEHGDPPAGRPGLDAYRKAVTVVTMARLPRREVLRATGAPGGFLEATDAAAVAAVAGLGLVAEQWPWKLAAGLRQDWLHQQRDLACLSAEQLGGDTWRMLTLPLGGKPQVFHYRESDYGWVLAAPGPVDDGDGTGCFLAAFGHGVSAYPLVLARAELSDYQG
ncbi:MAG TPA: hypothetical protein VGX23_06300 [Actinocrinis sp.]|nr:hypothetical protein [Actinocrinis sp.]